MAKINVPVKVPPVFTHEGGLTAKITPEKQLRRTVAACLLWEDTFYENGKNVAERIMSLVPLCRPSFVAACAYEARTKQHLRHVPLLLAREMARYPEHKKLVSSLLPDIIQRADELTEFLAIYWKDKRQPLSKQVKKGLSTAFGKFNEYALAKYNGDGAIKLRDVLFLTHAKPKDKEQEALWKRLIDGKLISPETWENKLSRGEDKKAVFSSMMKEKQLGGLAFLRNLRNMRDAGVDPILVKEYAESLNVDKILPFRFMAAARHVPEWESYLEVPMLKALNGCEKLSGKTLLFVDVSGSMTDQISAKSDLTRLDAAKALAILLRSICEDISIYTFNTNVKVVPSRIGFALADAIGHAHGGTQLGTAVRALSSGQGYDRFIVLTDEQTSDRVDSPSCEGYIINVASYKNGVDYGSWNKINGWSEAVVQYIQELEHTNE